MNECRHSHVSSFWNTIKIMFGNCYAFSFKQPCCRVLEILKHGSTKHFCVIQAKKIKIMGR